MIRRLRIQGFQSLDDVDLQLGALTVIVGESNSGKSAVRRALAGLVRNDPAGALVRQGAEKAVVSIDLDDAVVTWEKGKGRNAYILHEPDGSVTFDKPGAGVPDPVVDVLRIDPDLHLTTQFDPPYLLTDTSSAAAKALGGLTNIATLFDAIREANRQKGAAKKAEKTTRDLADEAHAKLAGYEDLRAEAAVLDHAGKVLHEAHAAENAALRTAEAVSKAQRLQESVRGAHEALAATKDVTAAHEALATAHEAVARATELTTHAEMARNLLARTERADYAELPDIEAAASWAVHAADMVRIVDRARTLAATAEARTIEAAQATERERTIAAELEDIDVCPLCEQPIHGAAAA